MSKYCMENKTAVSKGILDSILCERGFLNSI